MKVDVLVAEIGSTTTVVNAFDGLETDFPQLLGQGMSPTTVDLGDVTIGLNLAMDNLKTNLGTKTLDYKAFYASSSAAGGLKMTVHGLVYDMTVKAAKEAVLGAGGNIKWITAGPLSEEDLEEIAIIRPNLIFVSGGLDYGERETALNNSLKLAETFKDIPMIYAGNCVNQSKVKRHFDTLGRSQDLFISENVYPKIDILNVEGARRIIQDAFERNITQAAGMHKIHDLIDGSILPTPGAVMKAAQVLETFLGDLVVVDLGGATTDIHSVTNGDDQLSKIALTPEPKAKRTVEGDLGVYVNADQVVKRLNKEKMCRDLGVSLEDLIGLCNHPPQIPKSELEMDFVHLLAQEAIQTAVNRHVGTLTQRFNGVDSNYVEGKDLTKVKYLIGTGGVLTRLRASEALLKRAFKNSNGRLLLPEQAPHILIDRDYIMASIGVLSQTYPEAAKRLLKKTLK